MQRLRLSLLLAVALLLGACSNIRLVYDHAETVVMFWADGYADFTRDQEAHLRPALQQLLAWHRVNHLPEYQKLLQRIAARVDPYTGLRTPMTAAEIRALEDEFRGGLRGVADRALPTLVELAMALQPAQIERIDRKLGDNIEKYRREAIGNEAGMKKRADRAIDRAEDWLGRLNRSQREQVRGVAEKVLAPHAVVLEQSQQRRRTLVGLLRRIQAEKLAPEQVGALLRAYIDTMLGGGDDDYQRRARQIGLGNAELTATIVNLATIEQRAHATRRLQDWASDFGMLASTPPR